MLPTLPPEKKEIKGFGITLKKLAEEDLEAVRQWRNAPEIQSKMIFQKEITAEEQLRWFHTINNQHNFYYVIINPAGEKIGLINIKDVDYAEGKGEGGIFMLSNESDKGFTSVKASLLMCDFGFNHLGLKEIFCRVLNQNSKAISYNKRMGYVFDRQDETVSYGHINPERFKEIYAKYAKLVQDI